MQKKGSKLQESYHDPCKEEDDQSFLDAVHGRDLDHKSKKQIAPKNPE